MAKENKCSWKCSLTIIVHCVYLLSQFPRGSHSYLFVTAVSAGQVSRAGFWSAFPCRPATRPSGTAAWPANAVRCRPNRIWLTSFACWPSRRRPRRFHGGSSPHPKASPATRRATTMWVARGERASWTNVTNYHHFPLGGCICRRWRPAWGTSWSLTGTPRCRSAPPWSRWSERPSNWNCKYVNCRWDGLSVQAQKANPQS